MLPLDTRDGTLCKATKLWEANRRFWMFFGNISTRYALGNLLHFEAQRMAGCFWKFFFFPFLN